MLLPLSGDAVMIFVGLGIYIATCLLTRHALRWGWALVPGLVLAVAIETWEVLEHYGLPGLTQGGPSGVLEIALRHYRDVVIYNLAPFSVWASAYLLKRFARD